MINLDYRGRLPEPDSGAFQRAGQPCEGGSESELSWRSLSARAPLFCGVLRLLGDREKCHTLTPEAVDPTGSTSAAGWYQRGGRLEILEGEFDHKARRWQSAESWISVAARARAE
jgi:hypothetical protein